jgi:Lysozyme like domain
VVRASSRPGQPGTLGCAGLEALWVSAGGSPSAEVTAASIAMAESSGNQYATGPVGERGYWQISPIWGALSTYDAYGNAQAAVTISNDGSNWTPWTTFLTGAYAGQC